MTKRFDPAPALGFLNGARRRALALAIATGRDEGDMQSSANLGDVTGLPTGWPGANFVPAPSTSMLAMVVRLKADEKAAG